MTPERAKGDGPEAQQVGPGVQRDTAAAWWYRVGGPGKSLAVDFDGLQDLVAGHGQHAGVRMGVWSGFSLTEVHLFRSLSSDAEPVSLGCREVPDRWIETGEYDRSGPSEVSTRDPGWSGSAGKAGAGH